MEWENEFGTVIDWNFSVRFEFDSTKLDFYRLFTAMCNLCVTWLKSWCIALDSERAHSHTAMSVFPFDGQTQQVNNTAAEYGWRASRVTRSNCIVWSSSIYSSSFANVRLGWNVCGWLLTSIGTNFLPRFVWKVSWVSLWRVDTVICLIKYWRAPIFTRKRSEKKIGLWCHRWI